MPTTGRQDIYSGVARLAGTIWGDRRRPAHADPKTVLVFVHPTSNFMGHYALQPMVERGHAAVGVAGRYVGNDSTLLVESCVADLGAVVRHLRDVKQYERVVLVGNSGGGALVSLYQSQAEKPTITATPAGDPPDLTQADLPPADGLVLFMAHPSRASVLTEWLDPAILDETDPFRRDPALDVFDSRNGPPYPDDFVTRFRQAQQARNRRITAWVKEQLAAMTDLTLPGVNDLPFVVHGTCADPRFLDLAVDPSDRAPGTLWGEPFAANYAPHTLGHHTSLRSWLSQWSIDDSNLSAPRHLPQVSVPVLVVHGSADQAVLPSHYREIVEALDPDRSRAHVIAGAGHYFAGRPELLAEACDLIDGWVRSEVAP
jgi:pimeloyl-ACP methyl ester carboxylesterase